MGGGGQPIHDGMELAGTRGDTLYELDRERPLRFSHENREVQAMYREYFGSPLSHTSHELLHVEQ